jgi:predicted dehydrogenase
MDEKDYERLLRRDFLKVASTVMGTTMLGSATAFANKIQGFNEKASAENSKIWIPLSDRKIKVGIVGAGVCRFGAVFGFQHHPNVEVVAVSDLIPERCQWLAKATNCKKMYPSLEELVKDKSIEAVFIATDAPSHARHCILALEHGKHVACAVPAVFGSLKDAQDLYDTVKKTGLKYMMFETSMYRQNLYAMRKLYEAGAFGDVVYTEGEYWHYAGGTHYVDSFKKWRDGMPP